MKRGQSDKHTIAWFRIAECVSRGEKERALGVYRLLSHSLEDSAYARQLEGDILLACHDISAATQRYYSAFELYQKSNRLLQACCVADHLLLLLVGAEQETLRITLATLYAQLSFYQKCYFHVEQIIQAAVSRLDTDTIDTTIKNVSQYCNEQQCTMLYRLVVEIVAQSDKEFSESFVTRYVTTFVNGALLTNQDDIIDAIAHTLEHCSHAAYVHILEKALLD